MAMTHKGSLTVTRDVTINNDLTVDNSMNVAGLAYPTSDGSANQVIETDGAGTLTFATAAAGGASDIVVIQAFGG